MNVYILLAVDVNRLGEILIQYFNIKGDSTVPWVELVHLSLFFNIALS